MTAPTLTKAIGPTLGMLLGLASATSTHAAPAGFADELVAAGFGQPTAMALAPDGRVFVAEQTGALRVVKAGVLRATPFVRLAVNSAGERGLLGIALHPSFASNGFVYLYHTVPGAPARNQIIRVTADGDIARPGSAVTILALDNLSAATDHNGGAIHFGHDGKLYVAVGENKKAANAQSLANRLGKILRVNADGSIPADNPTSFPGIVGTTNGANRAIWAVGLRNPFTFTFRPSDGAMVVNDVGASAYEEVNRGRAGANYGWPASQGPTANGNFVSPIFAYQHNTGSPVGCAITGAAFYNPQRVNFPASYVGKYFFADYCGGWIYRLDLGAPGAATLFHSGLSGPVDLAVGSDGALYYVQRGNGQLRRVRYSGQTTQSILLSASKIEIAEGSKAAVMARLAARPAAPVRVALVRDLSAPGISANRNALDFTGTNWNVEQRVVIAAAEDSDDLDDGARFRFASTGLPSALVTVTAVDNDRPSGFPRAIISKPLNGDTVSGSTAEFFGDGVSAATLKRAEYWIDGVLRHSDVNGSGHYHFGGGHNRWNTATLSNGTHVLTMRVVDAQGRSGAHRIRVGVSN